MVYKSGLAPVDDIGTQLYYEDTGPPTKDSTEAYTTLFLIHGAVFHSAIFRRLHPHALHHNLRIVALNRRGYPSSTPYTHSELEALRGQDKDAQATRLRALALQIASFVHWFVQTEKIGQAAVLAWSAGNVFALAMLAHAHTFPPEIAGTIEQHCRCIILYDCPQFVCELSYGRTHPMWDPTLPPSKLVPTLYSLMSGYFSHPSPHSRNASGLTLTRNPSKTPSIDRMTPAELASVSHCSPLDSPDVLLTRLQPGVRVENLVGALRVSESVWPDVQIKLVPCMESAWEMLTARWEIERRHEELRAGGVPVRTLSVHEQCGANHFAHWDIPEETMQFLANVIRS
ncbi:hypothetical protein GLOTRDRAFT_31344 [Gloeophyllum trabeum ATCC 11539]|uniref:AB hydrolase-1 domain-containing protein n=1 Tax=Gloeophyllum trabeum (strain ATCC 11539 / FP-39264 / Madison 617) TaxID=670483 RepID=S7S2S2_GLOTA|nr:uncharacterized protein GLOTRDRAFT_31344 [Gloeophyllum trabeum ATCC 11539]EPQ60079.1 hypothetical protein GLOTRDRAFT_31344 [Gloeophyllum trabeum ATCC 11539]